MSRSAPGEHSLLEPPAKKDTYADLYVVTVLRYGSRGGPRNSKEACAASPDRAHRVPVCFPEDELGPKLDAPAGWRVSLNQLDHARAVQRILAGVRCSLPLPAICRESRLGAGSQEGARAIPYCSAHLASTLILPIMPKAFWPGSGLKNLYTPAWSGAVKAR